METQDDLGFSIVSVSVPSGAVMPTDDQTEILFRVRARISVFDQEAHFDLKVPAHGFDEAVQKAYSIWAFTLGAVAKQAKETHEALLKKCGAGDS